MFVFCTASAMRSAVRVRPKMRMQRVLLTTGFVCFAVHLVFGSFSLLFLPKTTFRVGMLINVPFDETIFHGLMFRGNYPLYPEMPRNSSSLDRWGLYESLEGVLERFGLQGRPCMLRAVCEAAAHSVDHDGIVGAALHILLSPSSSSDNRTEGWHRAYVRAERWGSRRRDCSRKFGTACPTGVLQAFTTLG